MIKQLTIEDLCNLEGGKLLYNLGYILNISIKDKYLILTYKQEYDGKFYAGDIEFRISLEQNIIKITLINSKFKNVAPVLYPIMKILEELKIDIEKVYFDQIKKDDKDE